MNTIKTILKTILNRLKGPRNLNDVELAVVVLDRKLDAIESHLIALARLGFIKPDRFVEEANNIKGNADYLTKMIEAKEKGKKK